MSEFAILCAKIEAAKEPVDIFGADDVHAVYRRLVVLVHPDKHAGDERAAKAFRRLTELRDQALGVKPPPTPLPPLVVTVAGKSYTIGELLATGDVADIYSCAFGTEPDARHVLKVAARAAESDLIEAEAKTLKKIRADDRSVLARYVPKLEDAFTLKSGKTRRKAVILKRYQEHLTLAQLLERKRGGFDFRDVAWMLRRALEGLSLLHAAGVVHGAFLPEHFMVHPKSHQGKIIDWCYAVKQSERIHAISERRRDHYPPEVFAKQPATPALDIFMCAKTFLEMLDGREPNRFRGFLEGCLLASPARRPQSAAQLYDEFAALLLLIVGKPAYRELVL